MAEASGNYYRTTIINNNGNDSDAHEFTPVGREPWSRRVEIIIAMQLLIIMAMIETHVNLIVVESYRINC